MSRKKFTTPGGTNDIGDVLNRSRSKGITSIIERAVVYDTLTNLSVRDEETVEEIKGSLLNHGDFDIAPRNSIIIKYISMGAAKSARDTVLCFPFFSSHISLPVKVGEQVWVILETPENKAPRGYWLSRIHEPVSVEDVNYTHGDRRNIHNDKEKIKRVNPKGDVTDHEPEDLFPFFINGKVLDMDDVDQLTLPEKDAYETIYKETKEHNSFVIEPVPRFTKRPGDLVLQGSHNTAIILGSVRGYTIEDKKLDREKTNANLEEKLKQGVGSIDIVAGRGRINVALDDLDGKDKRDKEPSRTEPRVIKTTLGPKVPDPAEGAAEDATVVRQEGAREVFETDKQIELVNKESFSNTKTDACEGDPDFINDASRFYLTMKSNPDDEFALKYPQCPPVGDPNDGADVEPVKDSASSIIKSDEIRIIARHSGLDEQKDAEMADSNKLAKDIAGSIKLIKEGKPDSEDGDGRAVIMMQPDGVIMIDGPKVVIGSGLEKENGKGTQVSLGLGATEPVVLGDILKAKLEAYMDAVSAAFQYASTHVHPTGTGPSGPPTGEQWSAKKGDIDTTKGELSEILSKLAKTL